MALITSAWLMGSATGVPATSIDITANAVTETMVLAASDYYVWDGLAANSALNQVRNAILAHSEVTTCGAFIGQDMRARLNADISYTIDSWTDLTIRNVLGFTGTEAFGAATQVAGRSAYLWSPGRCEIPDAPVGAHGLPYHDTARGMSGNRVAVATTNNSGSRNRFVFRRVFNDRVMTASLDVSEHASFWDAVQRRFARFKLYRNITEEDTDTDDTTTFPLPDPLGPYVWDNPSGDIAYDYNREIERVELFSTVDIPVILTNEYD